MDCAFGLTIDLVNSPAACQVVGTVTQVFRESCCGSWKNFVPDMRITSFGGL
jgi:hypothetical protein